LGFDNQAQRIKDWLKIGENFILEQKSKQNFGKSYRNNQLKTKKHSKFILHVIATIALANKASKYNNGSEWTKENLKKILIEGKDSVTFDIVQSWYCRTFTKMFPDCEYLVYL
jgi:hypothetical protein